MILKCIGYRLEGKLQLPKQEYSNTFLSITADGSLKMQKTMLIVLYTYPSDRALNRAYQCWHGTMTEHLNKNATAILKVKNLMRFKGLPSMHVSN